MEMMKEDQEILDLESDLEYLAELLKRMHANPMALFVEANASLERSYSDSVDIDAWAGEGDHKGSYINYCLDDIEKTQQMICYLDMGELTSVYVEGDFVKDNEDYLTELYLPLIRRLKEQRWCMKAKLVDIKSARDKKTMTDLDREILISAQTESDNRKKYVHFYVSRFIDKITLWPLKEDLSFQIDRRNPKITDQYLEMLTKAKSYYEALIRDIESELNEIQEKMEKR